MNNLINQWAKQYLINEGKEDPSMENPDEYKQDEQFKNADEYEEWMKEREKMMSELDPNVTKESEQDDEDQEQPEENPEDKSEENPEVQTDVETEKDDEGQEKQDESAEYDLARKVGYRGDEKDVADWLKGSYGKWKVHTLEVMTRLANGDDKKAMDWFKTYDRLSSAMYGTRFGTENGYVDSEVILKDLAKELGDDPEAKELIKKIEDKWESDRKSLIDFYDSGRYTGD